MEKRLLKVQRWIGRCVLACRSEAWQNALADVECARAELEMAREALWKAAEGNEARGLPMSLRTHSRVFLLTMIIMLAAAVPLSKSDLDRGVVEVAEDAVRDSEMPSFEWITSDERVLLEALRRSLSTENSAVVYDVNKNSENNEHGSNGSLERKEDEIVKDSPGGSANGFAETVKDQVPIDQVIDLVHIGRNALREHHPAIIIEK